MGLRRKTEKKDLGSRSHGKLSGYSHGCRCDECFQAYRDYRVFGHPAAANRLERFSDSEIADITEALLYEFRNKDLRQLKNVHVEFEAERMERGRKQQEKAASELADRVEKVLVG
jgi:hypothetical protein